MRVKKDKKSTGKVWRQVGPGELCIILVVVIVVVVIILCCVWHLCRQKDKEPCFTDTVFVEHTVVIDTLRVNVLIYQGDEFSPSEDAPRMKRMNDTFAEPSTPEDINTLLEHHPD